MEKGQEDEERDVQEGVASVRNKAFSTSVNDSSQSSTSDPTDYDYDEAPGDEALRKSTSSMNKETDETTDTSTKRRSIGWESSTPDNIDSNVVTNTAQALLDKIPSLQATVLPDISETQKVARPESGKKQFEESDGLKQSCDAGSDLKTTGSTNESSLLETVKEMEKGQEDEERDVQQGVASVPNKASSTSVNDSSQSSTSDPTDEALRKLTSRPESGKKQFEESDGSKQSCDAGSDSKTTGLLETDTMERINRLAEQVSKESRKEILIASSGSLHRYHSNPEDEKVFSPVCFGDMVNVEEPGSMARSSSILKLSSSHQLLNRTRGMRRSVVLENYTKPKVEQAEESQQIDVSSQIEKQQIFKAGPGMSDAESPKVAVHAIAKAPKKWKGIKSTNASKREFVESDMQYKLLQKYNDEVITKLPMPLKIALYEEAQPIVLKTIRGYEKLLGKSHPLTQQANEKLIAVNHTLEMLSEL